MRALTPVAGNPRFVAQFDNGAGTVPQRAALWHKRIVQINVDGRRPGAERARNGDEEHKEDYLILHEEPSRKGKATGRRIKVGRFEDAAQSKKHVSRAPRARPTAATDAPRSTASASCRASTLRLSPPSSLRSTTSRPSGGTWA